MWVWHFSSEQVPCGNRLHLSLVNIIAFPWVCHQPREVLTTNDKKNIRTSWQKLDKETQRKTGTQTDAVTFANTEYA